MKEPFVINNRYRIDPDKNLFIDQISGEESRLEQRLLAVLYMLTASPGKLVQRDKIIQSVWNDYGGGDEGLTQAISALRKVLNDADKTIIETIPRKGYILNASVTNAVVATAPANRIATGRKKIGKWVYVILLVIVAIILGTIYLNTSSSRTSDKSQNGSPDVINSGADTKQDSAFVPNPDVIPDSVRHHQ